MANFWQKRKILVSITTLRFPWKDRIEEANKLNLKEVGLFLTGIHNEKGRKELYSFLETSSIENVPFVHLRSDMKPEEIEYLIERFYTKVFNLHSPKQYPWQYDYSNFSNKIYLENTVFPLDEEELSHFAGVCIDFSHLERDKLNNPEVYRHNLSVIPKFKCGCNHVSDIDELHVLKKLSDLDYVKKYPSNFFSAFIALELENTLKEQLEAKKYLLELLKDKI